MIDIARSQYVPCLSGLVKRPVARLLMSGFGARSGRPEEENWGADESALLLLLMTLLIVLLLLMLLALLIILLLLLISPLLLEERETSCGSWMPLPLTISLPGCDWLRRACWGMGVVREEGGNGVPAWMRRVGISIWPPLPPFIGGSPC